MQNPTSSIVPRKRFGQNFLTDQNVIDNIIGAIAPKEDDQLVEIGPGRGALTQQLSQRCSQLRVIEIDRNLIKYLQQQPYFTQLTIIEGDALSINFAQLAAQQQLRIVGNLPYNISTPLLFHLLQYRSCIGDMHFMLQKEVVERLCGQAGSKNYGRLSLMVQYYAQVEALFDVPPTCFYPAPKVNSMVVRITPHPQLPYPATDEDLLARLVNACFQQRRKTLRNSLRQICNSDMIQQVSIDTQQRPEQLSLAEFVELCNELHDLMKALE